MPNSLQLSSTKICTQQNQVLVQHYLTSGTSLKLTKTRHWNSYMVSREEAKVLGKKRLPEKYHYSSNRTPVKQFHPPQCLMYDKDRRKKD